MSSSTSAPKGSDSPSGRFLRRLRASVGESFIRRIFLLSSCALGGLSPLAGFAQTVSNITYTSGQNVTVSSPAQATITAGPNVTVASGATVMFRATGTVTLSSGFTAAAGSSFQARIVNPDPVPPTITQQPTSHSVPEGQGLMLYVSAADPNLSYQWYKNGAPIYGDGSSILIGSNQNGTASWAWVIFLNIQAGDAGVYTALVSNSFGSVLSNPAVVTVAGGGGGAAPIITTHPQSQTVAVGSNATFTVAVSGDPTLTYQWRKNGVNISGATSASLALTNVQSVDAATYTCYVSNPYGNATSNGATLTVNTGTPPSITTHPQSHSVAAGTNITFSVIATGTAPLSYQWRKNSTAIPGATNASYVLNNVQAGDAGSYDVVVTNNLGSATSVAATLSISGGPTENDTNNQNQLNIHLPLGL